MLRDDPWSIFYEQVSGRLHPHFQFPDLCGVCHSPAEKLTGRLGRIAGILAGSYAGSLLVLSWQEHIVPIFQIMSGEDYRRATGKTGATAGIRERDIG